MKALYCLLLFSIHSHGSAEMVELDGFWIDKTEVSIAEFASFAEAQSLTTQAERQGGGLVYEFGWQQKAGWNWRTPYGVTPSPQEPAVHLTYDEAAAFCHWSGKRLPTESEWISAAYTEQRANKTRETYLYPTGDSPGGANCLEGCGRVETSNLSTLLQRGRGHIEVGVSREGVNGLYDMGANVWEWVNIENEAEKGTRGGSWWYGTRQMQADYRATKPRDMAVVYIGFRCIKDKLPPDKSRPMDSGANITSPTDHIYTLSFATLAVRQDAVSP